MKKLKIYVCKRVRYNGKVESLKRKVGIKTGPKVQNGARANIVSEQSFSSTFVPDKREYKIYMVSHHRSHE